jgi:xylulokinase
MAYLLGIDAGTTAFKAVLFDQDGKERASAAYEYDLEYPLPGWVELLPEKYWEAFKSVIRIIISKYSININEIKAMAIASQGETLIPVDQNGQALRKAIVWLDNRAASEALQMKAEFGTEATYLVTGQPDIVPTWPAAKILWMKENEKAIYNKVYKFLLLEDYLIFRLTNRFVSEGSLLSSSLLFDINTGNWWPEMLKYIGLDTNRLPEIVNSGQIIGELTDKAAKEIGLAKDLIVVTGALDQAASTIGAGNIGSGIITESTGSTLAICINTTEPVFDPHQQIPCHYHAIKGQYFLLPWCQTAGMVYKWFRNQIYCDSKKRGDINEINWFKQMDMEASVIPAGSDGLIMLPHLAGAFTPESNPGAKGVFFGITLKTTRGHFERSILEAVAYMLKRNLDLILDMGIDVNEIRSIGGGSKSELWNTIKADVCQKPVATLLTSETTSLGAAMLAGNALNIFNNLQEASVKMIHLQDKIEPKKSNVLAYSSAYKKYINLYKALEPLFIA